MFFLSGLPRSGSTLLQALLSQNPDIHVEGNSPVCQLMWDVKSSCENNSYEQLMASERLEFKDELIKSIPNLYYKGVSSHILDKCRTWTLEENLKLIRKYIDPNPKIIVMIRPIREIVNSFNHIVGNLDVPKLKEDSLFVPGSDPLMRPLAGIITAARNPDNKENLLIISYTDLIDATKLTLESVYKFLDIPQFTHDLSSVTPKKQENDLVYGVPDLHKVRSTISAISRPSSISESGAILADDLDKVLYKALENLI